MHHSPRQIALMRRAERDGVCEVKTSAERQSAMRAADNGFMARVFGRWWTYRLTDQGRAALAH